MKLVESRGGALGAVKGGGGGGGGAFIVVLEGHEIPCIESSRFIPGIQLKNTTVFLFRF